MRILFPITNRVHLARQKLLLEELKKDFQVDIIEYSPRYKLILNNIADIANYFRKVIGRNQYDLILIRGDRYEMLPIAMLCAYKGIPMAHLEGGDLSGAIDNKVRYGITALSDIHFATNKESFRRLISMGTDPDWTFNFGSLDVEYAKTVPIDERKNYVIMCHHPLLNENPAIIEKIIKEEFGGKIIIIKSNKDSGTSYGTEEYKPEEYIRLLAEARCLVGNSSSFLKEASIFGTPALIIGERQKNRLFPANVKQVSFDEQQIKDGFRFQMNARYEPDYIYYQEGTSKKIAEKIKEFLK